MAAEIARRLEEPNAFARAAFGIGLDARTRSHLPHNSQVAGDDELLIGLLEEAPRLLGDPPTDLYVRVLVRLALECYGLGSFERGSALSAESAIAARKGGDRR